MNIKFLLIGTSLSLIPNITYAQCAVTDCLQLGYTSLQKCDNGLKCPFGEYWACPKIEEKAVLGECTGYAKNCKIADILNSDGTCTTDKVSGKNPLGVVIAMKDNCGWIMTTKPIQTEVRWSTEYVSTGVFQSNNAQQVIQDFDVSGNMAKIIQASKGNSSTYPAAYVALNYTPNAAPTTKGKRALPSFGLLHSLFINLSMVNNTISRLGGIPLENYNEGIWSSSECHSECAWFLCTPKNSGQYFCGDGIGSSSKIYNSFPNIGVRPVLAF